MTLDGKFISLFERFVRGIKSAIANRCKMEVISCRLLLQLINPGLTITNDLIFLHIWAVKCRPYFNDK